MMIKLKSEIIKWNNKFPLDRWWRHKYNIPFGSKTHLEISQLDIYFEYLEEKVFEEYQENLEREEIRKSNYESGIWIKDSRLELKSNIDEVFRNLDLDQFNG